MKYEGLKRTVALMDITGMVSRDASSARTAVSEERGKMYTPFKKMKSVPMKQYINMLNGGIIFVREDDRAKIEYCLKNHFELYDPDSDAHVRLKNGRCKV